MSSKEMFVPPLKLREKLIVKETTPNNLNRSQLSLTSICVWIARKGTLNGNKLNIKIAK
jgi:hypothetical protein